MSPATMTLAVPKRPAEKRLPKATEILSMARSAPRSDEVSPASVAAAKSQSAVRKKKTARKPPPWYKILIANAVLFAIVYGAYCTWHSHEDKKPLTTESAAVQPSGDSKRPATKAPRAGQDSAWPIEENRSPAEQGPRSDPVKPPESDRQEATPAEEVPPRLPNASWDRPSSEPEPKKGPEPQKEDNEPLEQNAGRDEELPGPKPTHEDLQAKLLRRKRTISTSTAVYDAVANKEIRIIEVADGCTADQFDAEQTRLLRGWVSAGGVLWVNGNVLDLFGVRHSSGSRASFAHCVPAGAHPTFEGVKLALVDELADKPINLSYRGVIPLLTVKQEGRNYISEPPVGTTVWSLVPYGKGWISDPKPLGLKDGGYTPWALGHDPGQNALFWGQFCQFCLHELPWPEPAPVGDSKPADNRPLQASLTGAWQTIGGVPFRIEDDGTTLTVELVGNSTTVRKVYGKLKRREGRPDAKFFSGELDAVFLFDGKQHTLHTIMSVEDENHLKFRFADFPTPVFGPKTGWRIEYKPLREDRERFPAAVK